MSRMGLVSVLALAIGVSGCATVPRNEGAPAKISDVVGALKRDLDVYQKYDAVTSMEAPLNDACHGVVGFSIESVKVALTTSIDNSVAGNGSAVLPVPGATFGPSMSLSHDEKGTQTLTFSLYPKTEVGSEDVQTVREIDSGRYPIAANLKALREGLLEASRAKPCMALIPPADAAGKVNDPGGTFAFGFTVTNQATAGSTLKLIVYSLGATGSSQSQIGNTVTVSFKAHTNAAALMSR